MAAFSVLSAYHVIGLQLFIFFNVIDDDMTGMVKKIAQGSGCDKGTILPVGDGTIDYRKIFEAAPHPG